MNSNPILNREIVTLWHGEAQAAERNKLGKSKQTKLIHTSNNRPFDIIGYRANPASCHKNTATIHRLWQYFIQDPKAPQAIFLFKVLNFYSNLLADLRVQFRLCGWKTQDSVCLDSLSAQPKISTTSTTARVSTLDPSNSVLLPFARNPACESYLTFVLSAQHPRCCQQSLNLFCCDSEIFVNPAWSVILAHCHFDVALLPPWPVSYALPAMCPLFAPFLLILFLFRFRLIIVRKDFFPAELKWADLLCPFFWLSPHNLVVHRVRLFNPTFLFLFW